MISFETDILKLETQIDSLQKSAVSDPTLQPLLQSTKEELSRKTKEVYANLTPWQKVEVARAENRPKGPHFIDALISRPTFLSGDRCYGDDPSIIGCIGFFQEQPVMAIAQSRGHDTPSRVKCNFGMPKPEGYRKVQRLMLLAEKFCLPVLTFIDTPGAYPGPEAENRGQAEAIAKSVDVSLGLRTPIIATVIGEGGSGGALALATANSVLMLEHSVYSVISPEGCASILWRDGKRKESAAQALQCSAQNLKRLGVIHHIIEEPLGGAHRNHKQTFTNTEKAISSYLEKLLLLKQEEVVESRKSHFMSINGVPKASQR